MAVYKQVRSKYWWYKLTWSGELVRKSTKQTDKRVAEQMEAAHKTVLAKGEVGIRDRRPVPTEREFVERDFLPFVQLCRCASERVPRTTMATNDMSGTGGLTGPGGVSTFAAKPKTLAYYRNGAQRLLEFNRLSQERLDGITSDRIAEYVARRQNAVGRIGHSIQVASINRELQVLRRIFRLAAEWGRVEKTLPTVKMLPGENHRERVLTAREDDTELKPFELCTLRHTCLTRWATHMDPWTLAYLAGHGNMNITKRYVHPQEQTVRDAMERAELQSVGIPADGGYGSRQCIAPMTILICCIYGGRCRIRTCDPSGCKPAQEGLCC
jgi:hypothetical protein